MRRRILALLAALALALLAGCGGGKDDAVQPPSDPAPVQDEVKNDPAPSKQEDAASPAVQPEEKEEDPQPAPDQEPAEDQTEDQQPEDDQPDDAGPSEPETHPEEQPADPEPASDPEPDPEPAQGPEGENSEGENVMAGDTYTISVTLEGGSGRATVESPATLHYRNGVCWATIVWSSPNFDYMKVDGQRYDPINTEGNSTFEIPVSAFDQPLAVIADTVAMSEPHEVEYTLTFDYASMQDA